MMEQSENRNWRERKMEKVKKFLLAPDENKDEFWESDFLIWVDWRDFDDSIIKYFNDKFVLSVLKP